MNYKKIVASLVVILTLFAIGATESFIYPLDSNIYGNMEKAYSLLSLSSPSSSYPWSSGEVERMLETAYKRNPEGNTKVLLDSIKKENDKKIDSDKDSIKPHLVLAPEIYLHTNSSTYVKEENWKYGFTERKPFIKAEVNIALSSWFYTYSEIAYGWGRTTYRDEWTKLCDIEGYVGIGAIVDKKDSEATTVTKQYVYTSPFLFSFPDIDKINIETPQRAFISLGGKKWFITLGRDRLKWTKSHIGSFIFDDHLSYEDYLRVKLLSSKFSLEYVLALYETDTSSSVSSPESGMHRYFMAHALSITPLNSLRITASENIMYVTTSIDGEKMNFANIFHNLNNSYLFNAIAHLDISYTPIKGLNIYLQGVLDQATAPTESDKQAAAWGLDGGIEYTMEGKRGVYDFYLEGAYTTPMLYRREKSDFLLFQRYSTNVNYKRFLIFDYIGFPYGGDSIVIKAGADYLEEGIFKVTIEDEFMIHGEMDYYKSHSLNGDNNHYPDIKDSTPLGKSTIKNTLSFSGEYYLPSFWYFKEGELMARVDLIYSSLLGFDSQFVLGFSIKL